MYHGVRGFDNEPKAMLSMEKGDTVFFHPILLHGSGDNFTKVGFAVGCLEPIRLPSEIKKVLYNVIFFLSFFFYRNFFFFSLSFLIENSFLKTILFLQHYKHIRHSAFHL